MDSAFVPLILLALVAGMYSTWQELRASLAPSRCSECPHCRDAVAEQSASARAEARRQAEVRSWYSRRNGLDDAEDDDRR